MYQGKGIPIKSVAGGYCGNNPPTELDLNQAFDLDNIILKDGGKGFRSRLGGSKLGTAVRVVQDLTYTAVTTGSAGELVTIAYTAGGTAGSEVVTVTSNAVSIQIQSGVSTATQVRTAFNLVAAATALATCTVSGTGTTAQTTASAAALAVTALNSGTVVNGLGWYLQTDGDNWLTAVVGNKFLHSSAAGPAFTDATGSLTIDATAGDLFTFVTFDDTVICFGGKANAPDAPFKWTGTGNAAALGGTPPSAYGGLAANNRVFAYRTAADPSKIFWTIVASAEDWTGVGSGNATVGSIDDNQKITSAILLNQNDMLIFKENSTYIAALTEAPFPIYSLYNNVGCIGKNAVVNVDGAVYFISSKGDMFATSGGQLQPFPSNADDLWNALVLTSGDQIQGFRHRGADFDHLVWLVTTTGTTNNQAIVWDILNKCWLRNTTGFKMHTAINSPSGVTYLGGYTGFIIKPEQSGIYKDAIENAAITSYWRSGWLSANSLNEITHIRKIKLVYEVKASGTITVKHGHDFTADSTTDTAAQTHATALYGMKDIWISGRGNVFQFYVGQSSSTIDMEINRIELEGKAYGQKGIEAN